MLNKVKKSKSEGFTIIEVMIVLAIAGLIILIVLLAVPALQRNSRNTAIKNDAAAVAGAISEFNSNNDGAKPNAAGSDLASGSVTLNNASGAKAVAKVQASTAYSDADAVAATTPVAGQLYVFFGAKCPTGLAGNATAVTPVTNNRGSVVVFGQETSDGVVAKCIDA
jgi:prepilin-type N-terminal cleavage/methylation domain-containing protein